MAQSVQTPGFTNPMVQLISINWEEDGVVNTIRMWGHARTVTDPVTHAARVDVELRQKAIFSFPYGAATTAELGRMEKKRKREKQAERRRLRQRCKAENEARRAAPEAVVAGEGIMDDVAGFSLVPVHLDDAGSGV